MSEIDTFSEIDSVRTPAPASTAPAAPRPLRLSSRPFPRGNPGPGRRGLAVLVAFLLVVSAAGAGSAAPIPSPVPDPVSVPPGDVRVTRIDLGEAPDTGNCLAVYDNTVNYGGLFYADQGGALALDGLHSLEGGGLCAFTFGYNQPGTYPVDALVVFYDNNASDSPPSNVVAGPYSVTGLPAGANSIQVTVPDGPVLGPDVWMGVQFSRNNTGLLIAGPPAVGESYDYFYEIPPGDYYFFGGSPVANFYLRIEVELAVPVERSTWGLLKSLER